MIAPAYQSELVTLYLGDCLTILPQLTGIDAVVTDPVWPNASVPLSGSDNPKALLADMFANLNTEIQRAAIHLGCDSDPRFLGAVPESFRFFRCVCLDLARVGYKGRLLMTGDEAYLFGEPPISRDGARVIPGRIVDADSKGKQSDHPCPRKLKHVQWLVNWWSEPKSSVLDPFMGSGTTGVACLRTGRKFVGIEIDPGYFQIALDRIRAEESQLKMNFG